MNKSTLQIPPDLQGDIESLAGPEGSYRDSAVKALRHGVKALLRLAQVERAVRARARPEPIPPVEKRSEPIPRPKRPRASPKAPSSWDRHAPRKYRVGRDYVGQLIESGKPLLSLPQAAAPEVQGQAPKLALGCACSEPGCEEVFQVTAEHYEHLQTAREKFGYRPRCPAHGGNDDAIAKARA